MDERSGSGASGAGPGEARVEAGRVDPARVDEAQARAVAQLAVMMPARRRRERPVVPRWAVLALVFVVPSLLALVVVPRLLLRSGERLLTSALDAAGAEVPAELRGEGAGEAPSSWGVDRLERWFRFSRGAADGPSPMPGEGAVAPSGPRFVPGQPIVIERAPVNVIPPNNRSGVRPLPQAPEVVTPWASPPVRGGAGAAPPNAISSVVVPAREGAPAATGEAAAPADGRRLPERAPVNELGPVEPAPAAP